MLVTKKIVAGFNSIYKIQYTVACSKVVYSESLREYRSSQEGSEENRDPEVRPCLFRN